MRQASIADRGFVKFQGFQIGQALQMLKAIVGNLRSAQIQLVQSLDIFYLFDAFVGNSATVFQAQLLQLFHSLKMRKSGVGYVRPNKQEGFQIHIFNMSEPFISKVSLGNRKSLHVFKSLKLFKSLV